MMSLPKIHIRTLMFVVILAALVAGTFALVARRAKEFQQRSNLAAKSAQQELMNHKRLARAADRFPPLDKTESNQMQLWAAQQILKNSRARFIYHRMMAKKYTIAARRPWLPVAPDPPEPN